MLYLAIDQHAKQITICVRNEDGDTVLRRQVSTRPEKIEAFFTQFTEMDSQFMAILEVCGFNDWLIEYLRRWNCREIVLIHPEKPGKRKTDRRDAQKLADLLWLNRERLAESQTVHGLRRVYMVSQKGILGFESKPLVSADFVNDIRSGIVDGPSTMMIDDTLVKILVWYDNEMGYANRMMELVKKVALTLPSRLPA